MEIGSDGKIAAVGYSTAPGDVTTDDGFHPLSRKRVQEEAQPFEALCRNLLVATPAHAGVHRVNRLKWFN